MNRLTKEQAETLYQLMKMGAETRNFYKFDYVDLKDANNPEVGVWLKGTQKISEDDHEDWDDFIVLLKEAL